MSNLEYFSSTNRIYFKKFSFENEINHKKTVLFANYHCLDKEK